MRSYALFAIMQLTFRLAANTQQLRWQNFCSRWTSHVELSSGPAAQSGYHLRTVQTTAEGTPFSGSTNTALCDFWYAAPWKTLTYLLTYIRLDYQKVEVKYRTQNTR